MVQLTTLGKRDEMPTRLRELKREALESAIWRGHDMSRFKSLHPNAAEASCRKCGKLVIVNSKPMLNGIEIHGRAVALGCDD